jgi:hypothetical protein
MRNLLVFTDEKVIETNIKDIKPTYLLTITRLFYHVNAAPLHHPFQLLSKIPMDTVLSH